MDQFKEDCLLCHNELRKKHGVPPLELDQQLCDVAQKWADKLAAERKMYHSSGPYGENIYSQYSSTNRTADGRKAVEMWYSEIQFYKGSFENAGHFTQVVWKSSKRLGVGYAISKEGTVYVVANYDPPGNFAGQFQLNVPPLCS